MKKDIKQAYDITHPAAVKCGLSIEEHLNLLTIMGFDVMDDDVVFGACGEAGVEFMSRVKEKYGIERQEDKSKEETNKNKIIGYTVTAIPFMAMYIICIVIAIQTTFDSWAGVGVIIGAFCLTIGGGEYFIKKGGE